MDKWEYLHVSFQVDTNTNQWSARWTDDMGAKSEQGTVNAILNTFGDKGWELVGFGPPGFSNSAVFKRHKP